MQKEVWRERVMQDGGVIPVTGCPTRRWQGNEERAKTTRTRCKHGHLIQHMHSFTGVVSAVIPSKRAFSECLGFDGSGSSCSRVAEGSSGTRRL